MQRIRRLSLWSLWSEKTVSQRWSNCIVPPHNRQSTSATAEAVATATWQLEQRKIAASQEIVVTTTTLTLSP